MWTAMLLCLSSSDPVHPDLADLAARWKGAMEACDVSALGMVLVEGDEVVHRVTLGRRDPAREAPVTKDTLFYIASATKPYVAFALAQLAEAGKLELDAPVKRYLPRFGLADAELTETITVRDLLSHRHGLNSGPIVMLDAYTGEITEERYYHFLEAVESPGHPAYSNLHFTLAGRVIEAVSGKPWRDFLARELFAPAGMARTTGYADWMYAQDDVAIPTDYVAGRAVPAAPRKSDRTMHAAGGLGTTLEDLARWLRLQLGRGSLDGRRLLSAEATAATWELQTRVQDDADFGPGEGFGLGWQRGSYRGHLELRHGGGYVGAASYVCFLPELGLGLAVVAAGAGGQVLARLVSTDVHERLLADDRVFDPLPGMLERVRAEKQAESVARASAPPLELSLPLASYVGTYVNEWFGTLRLDVRGDRLAGQLGELAFECAGAGPERLRVRAPGAFTESGEFTLKDARVQAFTLELSGPVRFERP